MKYLIVVPALLAASAALAEGEGGHTCSPPLKVVGPFCVIPKNAGKPACATPRKIALYNEHGKWQDERPESDVATGRDVIACNEEFGLVKVALTDGTPHWIDRADLILEAEGAQLVRKVCVQSEVSRTSDHKEAAVSGIDSKECVPDPPASTRKP